MENPHERQRRALSEIRAIAATLAQYDHPESPSLRAIAMIADLALGEHPLDPAEREDAQETRQ